MWPRELTCKKLTCKPVVFGIFFQTFERNQEAKWTSKILKNGEKKLRCKETKSVPLRITTDMKLGERKKMALSVGEERYYGTSDCIRQ